MDLAGYAAAARRWWLMLVIAAAVAGVAGHLAASRLTPTYASTVRLLVGPVNSDTNTLRGASQLVQTYSELVQTAMVLDPTIAALGLDVDRNVLRSALDVSANDATRLVAVRVSWADPETAARVANELATQLIAVAGASPSRPESELSVVDPADPAPPTTPNPLLVAMLAALAGFAASVAAAYLLEALDPSVRTAEDARSAGDLAVLGTVAGASRLRRPTEPLVVRARPSSRDTLEYRLLAGRVVAADPARPARSVFVAGVDSESAGSDVAANLAAALAAAGRRVLLADASERAGLTRLFGLDDGQQVDRPDDPGRHLASDGIVSVLPGIELLPGGMAWDRHVTDDAARSILDDLLTRADVVVVDGGALDRSTASLAWSRATDATLLVVRPHRTRRALLAFAAESLRLSGARVAGVVLHRGGTSPAARPPVAAAAARPARAPRGVARP